MKKSIAIIGGGAAALFASAFLDTKKFDVTIYEQKKSVGRKFLVAGDGGFNLSHGEDIHKMIDRYTPDYFLKNALLNFSNDDLQAWLLKLDIPTFKGSSNRIYPEKGIKPISVLSKIKQFSSDKDVRFLCDYQWKGWTSDNDLIFTHQNNTENKNTIISADYTIFSMGGGSWKITGSDGTWLPIFEDKSIKTRPFLPSNCAYKIAWKPDFILKNEGKPLKNIALSCLEKTQKGELVITKFGLEGNAIYALSPEIQSQLSQNKQASIYLDLKPMFSLDEIFKKINTSNYSITDILKKVLKLSPVQIDLLKSFLTKEEYLDKNMLAQKIKSLPLIIEDSAPLNEAISTTGGVSLEQVTENFELKNLKNTFCIGEMLDWNAPTGGYLLQACFSMGVFVADYLNEKDINN
ncbi:TIGR03862 family flavoprotein [Tenacibaculum finnmarkense]|uniref:TIGR03862 family flavoprotein n=1 Tax=Tenacibaculum finnmarkense TaxID=2781243 RepID=UPI001E2EFEA7|nr:TIGR03862 family flavoprotein [Tenacibaculum finnmarkense]MCD8403421.1 TIGR03862 family flavoprotein [Tenacibaculum finnmarkense genomovar finnmarkense]